MAKPETLKAFGKAAPTYNGVGPPLFSHFAVRLVEFSGLEPMCDVLDVATGSGAVLLDAALRSGGSGRLVGVDVTEQMLHRAAAEFERHGLSSIELHRMDAEALEFEDASFDMVFCGFAFSSFPAKRKAAEEFERVLRPDGRVCIADGFGWYFDQDARWAWHRELLEAVGCRVEESEFGSTDLRDLLIDVGLTNPETKHETYELVFSDEHEWWDWSWSHGTRLLFGAIPPARLDYFRDAAFAELRALREGEGRLAALMHADLNRADKARS